LDATDFSLGAGVVLSVSFYLSGLPLWMPVRVTFIGPQGGPVSWITPENVPLLESDRSEATTRWMYPTVGGYRDWAWDGAQDEVGAWSVDIAFAGRIYTANYTLGSLAFRDLETVSLGTHLIHHQTPGSNIHYSDLVPTALIADLQEHLSDGARLLEQSIQIEPGTIPDVYLMGNRDLMGPVSSVTGIDLGFEDGYYTNSG